jgi:hypothetical protein
MDQPMLVEGPAALDTIIHTFAPKLAETWPGDEALVGMIVQETERVGIVWAPREKVLTDLSKRKATENDPKRRQRYESAVASLNAARATGKVLVLVAGWGDMLTIEVEAGDLRMGKTFTTWQGGTA